MSEKPKTGFTFTDAVVSALETGDTNQLKEIGKIADEHRRGNKGVR